MSAQFKCPQLDLDPFSDDFLADPEAFNSQLLDAGPVFELPALSCIGMARHAQVQTALRDHTTFVSGRGVGLSDFLVEKPWRPPSLLLEADPPLHDRTRKLMNKVASLSVLRALQDDWQIKAHQLVEELVERRNVDVVTDLAEQFPLMVFPDLIGLQREGRESIIPYGTAVFNAFGPRNAVFLEAEAEAQAATEWVAQSCKRERLLPGGWGMAVYEAADRGECSPDEAERLVRSFVTAGVDTTVNGIANMVYALARHPEQWRALREEPGLARRAFEESLRWNGTVRIFFRTAARDVEIERVSIPEGTKVLLFLSAANRDPRQWERADEFDIRRSASGHVGFGFGIHQCLGQMVARMEAEVVLSALIPRVSEFRPAALPRRRLNNTLNALRSIPVELVPA